MFREQPQQTGVTLQSRVAADMHGLCSGEFHEGGTCFSAMGTGCSPRLDVHDLQEGGLTWGKEGRVQVIGHNHSTRRIGKHQQKPLNGKNPHNLSMEEINYVFCVEVLTNQSISGFF